MEPPSLPPQAAVVVERAVAPIAFPDPALETVLRRQLFPPGSPPGACEKQAGVRYIYNRIDLNGDQTPETLVALLGRAACGSEGCPLMVLRDLGMGTTPVQTIGGFRSAVVVSQGRTAGWRDLILPQGRLGESQAAPVLRHNGLRYAARTDQAALDPRASRPPGNPSLDRASQDRAPLDGRARGVMALAIQPRDYRVQGHLLPCPSVGPALRRLSGRAY